MPWTAREAKNYNSKAVGALATLWARVANETRASCLREGKSESYCDALAVRTANAAVEANEAIRRKARG